MKHAYQDMHHLKQKGYIPRWWVSELPGHEGAVRIKAGQPGRNSDWGWTDKKEKALPLSPYWQRRFMAYGRGCWKSYGLVEV